MLTVLDTIIGFVAPHHCLACGVSGDLLCTSCLPLLPDLQPQCYRCHRTNAGNKTCRSCRSSTPIRQTWIRTTYDGFGEALIRQLKFERAYAAADTIARSMMELPISRDAILVPVPTASGRVRQRGYDQAVLIAKRLSKHTGMPCRQILERHGQQRQTGNKRSDRVIQLEGAFHVKTKDIDAASNIILVDDVMTTGATLEAAARILRDHGIKHIGAITFARA